MPSTNLEAFFGLPADVVFCKNCVISNQRPRSTVEFKHATDERKATIGFGADGICEACTYHLKRNTRSAGRTARISWSPCWTSSAASAAMTWSSPAPGGKDSAFTSHVLKYRYGMNPLTVTWAPHAYTEIGWKNFENWIHVGGHDNILFTPNGRLHRLLTRLAFKNLLHPFQPFIVGQRIIGPRMAERFGVELVMYGENQAEYGNASSENYIPTMDRKFFSTDDPTEMLLGGVKIADIIRDHGYTLNDFEPYIPPSAQSLTDAGVEVHYLGYYLKWDPQECYYYASEHTGFRANTERTPGTYSKYSSIDDKIDMFHYFTTLIKFGIGRATYDAAQEVRNGKITRDEAVKLVQLYDQEFPAKFFDYFLEYIDMSPEEFWQTVDSFRSPHLWVKEGDQWRLRHQVT
ncbi:MAG: N-acetyl sugar amidotransferase [Rhodobacter sp.]|nr:N-acetyl sugar amidotransferase [Rhodobacter sp.]